MIPLHLSSNTPSTSAPNGKIDTKNLHGNTVRYVYPLSVVGTVPMRIKVRPQIQMDDGVKFEALSTIGPRSTIIDPRIFCSRPTTVAQRKRRAPLRTPIFNMIQVCYPCNFYFSKKIIVLFPLFLARRFILT